MKKFILTVAVIVLLYMAWDVSYYRLGLFIDFHPDEPVTTVMTTDEDTIYMDKGNGPEPFTIKGVNVGAGIPGEWATDFAIDKETYLRWFKEIQEMGANTIRVYTILHNDFYDALYEYNENNDDPLYLIHGVWVNDYVQNSHRDAYDDDFRQTLLDDCRTVIDLLHGNKKLSLGYGVGSGSYRKDVSPWVIGYIIGVEWEDVTVTYTDHNYPDMKPYQGTYMSATEDASAFESFLAEVGDKAIEYESKRYKQQRLVAFSNWPTTDPFLYPEEITVYFMKCAQVDVEHITTTENFLSGQFASYHVYPYYPDYLYYILNDVDLDQHPNWDAKDAVTHYESSSGVPYTDVLTGNRKKDYYDSEGRENTYYAYLQMLTRHHNMPVVISEFGVSTGRGMAQKENNLGRNQGHMTEQEQGEALVSCWKDIMNAGCAGGCAFTWQDEWFKRTWNTMHAVDLDNTPYWSDYQTNEQYFGLLTFDPGEEESVCYVDGDVSEWKTGDKVAENGDMELSMKYDEKFIYFLVKKDGLDPEKDRLYIPIDTTQKTGSTYCENYDVKFQRASDFLMVIDGKKNSRLVVQERYENLRAMYFHETDDRDAYMDPPDTDTPVFKNIDLMLQTATPLLTGIWQASAETYETGKLRHGNANPESEDFDSLADFIFAGDYVEIRIPWQLLNFSNPSEMMIHDDYYENYGIENLQIDKMYVGIGSSKDGESRIAMEAFPLEGWGKTVTSHERLKRSYYILQKCWTLQD